MKGTERKRYEWERIVTANEAKGAAYVPASITVLVQRRGSIRYLLRSKSILPEQRAELETELGLLNWRLRMVKRNIQ